MKTFMCIVLALLATLALMAIAAWLIAFIESIEVDWMNPFDKIADHAEKTAKMFEAMRKERDK